jgi:hypothetical protein
MEPIDYAWAILKMPVYPTGVPGINFVTQGEDEDWTQDENLHGGLPGLWIKEGETFTTRNTLGPTYGNTRLKRNRTNDSK